MTLPATLKTALEAKLGQSITAIYRMGGGDINEAAQIEMGSDRLFVKWNRSSPPGMFTAEARGLDLIAATQTLKVPQVIAYAEADQNIPAYLVLAWFDAQQPAESRLAAEQLGEGLAALHRHTAEKHGLDHDNFIGRLPQKNDPEKAWSIFYRDQRIGEQKRQARESGELSSERERLLDALMKKLPDLLPEVAPSLLHGDLWGGNYTFMADNTPIIYDPAVYYGDREVEIAFTQLFGGFPVRFYEAYNAVFPLDQGYEERRALYQLYPLMVHMNLFGGHYGVQMESITRRYL